MRGGNEAAILLFDLSADGSLGFGLPAQYIMWLVNYPKAICTPVHCGICRACGV